MGQYWKLVNLDKREYVHPHELGSGLKLWEQLANHPGTGAALIILCAAMPEARGGGDFHMETGDPEYDEIAKRTIGRWAGDRIALVGDYAERDDLPAEFNADLIYALCNPVEEVQDTIDYCKGEGKKYGLEEQGRRLEQELRAKGVYKDITDDVCRVIEHELEGEFVGEGWRDFVRS